MNQELAIQVTHLSKIYKLYDNPVDRLKESLHPFRNKYHHDFYSLKDISCEVKKGETVGIIGKNGSGKSTLLKIITGVLTPTAGSAQVNGKVSALLELGAGFNPELTGLENVYLNGTLHGYTKKDMDAQLNDILSFADIGDFVHQPIKVYSSGMITRLAFAAAIHADPDILIVDEALAVGDEAFQRKCFGRLKMIKKQGGTIIFVSHSASTIVELCDRAILLHQGELLLSGMPKLVVSKYQQLLYAPVEKANSLREEILALNESSAKDSDIVQNETNEQGQVAPVKNDRSALQAYYDPNLKSKSTIEYASRGARIHDPCIMTPNGEKVNVLVRGVEYLYAYLIHFEKAAFNVRAGMMIKTIRGLELGGIGNPPDFSIENINEGVVLQVKIRFRCNLLPGVYFMNAGVLGTVNGNEVFLHRLVDALMFSVQPEKSISVSGIVDFSSNKTGQTETGQTIELNIQKPAARH